MRSALRNLAWAIALCAVVALVEMPLRVAWHSVRLGAQPAPSVLPVPVDGVSPAALRDSWNAARSGGRTHQGVDIFAPRGTPVRSTTDGVVARVGSNRLGGQVVWVVGPAGQRHYYAHLARFADVHAGLPIAAGALVGYVGDTGNARGAPPHLHYGIYTTRGAINPFPLLRAAITQSAPR